jgi:hypothetical protein
MLLPDLAVHDAVYERLKSAPLPPHLIVHLHAEIVGAMEEWNTEEEIITAVQIGLCVRYQESRAGDAHGLHGSTGKEIVGDDGGGMGEDQFDRRFWASLYAAIGPNSKTILFCPPIESCLKHQLLKKNFNAFDHFGLLAYYVEFDPSQLNEQIWRCAVAAYNAGVSNVEKGIREKKNPDLYTKDGK